ncbi:hypothetical protein POL68_09895 [Stigmatella sp. ncwal1]|uniref:Lipoprotein n=1 Tax=Stigmatella ashevillensis TaxID=2995309 RepID=A0ABT5D6L7_9BACT|nr:hypothetical protein [Stigmatella ashevillena]MDC0708778.1 hypothetical protein [Stigmatella ashevillena]
MKKGFFAAGVLALLSSCTTTPPTIGDPAPQLTDRRAEQAYQDIFSQYSDRAEIYDGFDTRVFAGATFQTMPFREARVQRQAQFQFLPRPRVEELLAKERNEEAQFHEFWMGVHVNDYRFEDFGRKNTIWRVVLLTPSMEVEPVSIERMGRSNLAMRSFYPYMGVFWIAYRVRFPKVLTDGTPVIPPTASHVHLRLASTLGHAELRVHAR